jgi:hypothetical protein
MSSTSVGNVVAVHKLEIGFVDLDIHEDDQLDEAQFAGWAKQASQLPGERM